MNNNNIKIIKECITKDTIAEIDNEYRFEQYMQSYLENENKGVHRVDGPAKHLNNEI